MHRPFITISEKFRFQWEQFWWLFFIEIFDECFGEGGTLESPQVDVTLRKHEMKSTQKFRSRRWVPEKHGHGRRQAWRFLIRKLWRGLELVWVYAKGLHVQLPSLIQTSVLHTLGSILLPVHFISHFITALSNIAT